MLFAISAALLSSLGVLAIPARRPPMEKAAIGSHAITVRTVESPAEFAGLRSQWDALHDDAPAATLFNSWLWQYRWWELYGADQPLRVLVASEKGVIVGILPLYIRTAAVARLGVKELRAVGTGGDTFPDHLGPVISRFAPEAAVLQALAESALQMPGWDVLLLTDLVTPSAFPSMLTAVARRAGAGALSGLSEKIRYIALPSAWKVFLASLKPDRRARMQRARRRLLAAHTVRFFVWSDADTMDQAVDKLVELHRKRWRASSDSFATREYVEVHRRIMKDCLERGWLRLYCLDVDGDIAAMSYCYRFRNRVFLMQS